MSAASLRRKGRARLAADAPNSCPGFEPTIPARVVASQ
jgi:hypothetical protein